MVSAVDERFHYIKRGDGLEQLFDYRADRAEVNDLAKNPEGEAALVRLRSAVAQFSNR
jgi:hypothetical protein